MGVYYIQDFEVKLPKILKLFEKVLDEVDIVVSDLKIIGIKYKNYYICQEYVHEVKTALKIKSNNCWSYRSLALTFLKETHKVRIKTQLSVQEKTILRKHYYKQRLEIWELVTENTRADELIKIDFNHLYLNQQKLPLPTEKNRCAETVQGKQVGGFYYIKHYLREGLEPVLPVWENGITHYKTGYGEGLYWSEEIDYFISIGGQIIEKTAVLTYKNSQPILKPIMEDFSKLAKRKLRKQLANQLYGNFGRKTWRYVYKLWRKDELELVTDNIKRTKGYGDFCLVEYATIKRQLNTCENLAWALVIAARSRVQVHKLIAKLQGWGVRIYYINMDEIIVDSNTLPDEFKKTHCKEFKKQNVTEEYLTQIRNQQWDLLYKRRGALTNNLKRVPWHVMLPKTKTK